MTDLPKGAATDAEILMGRDTDPDPEDWHERLIERIRHDAETIEHWRVKAMCYGDMVRGCTPALEAAGFPVDASQEDGAVGGVRRAVEAMAERIAEMEAQKQSAIKAGRAMERNRDECVAAAERERDEARVALEKADALADAGTHMNVEGLGCKGRSGEAAFPAESFVALLDAVDAYHKARGGEGD